PRGGRGGSGWAYALSPLRYLPTAHRKLGRGRGEGYLYRFSPLKEPTASETSGAPGPGGAGSSDDSGSRIAAAGASPFTDSRNVADGTKNRVPVTARLKSSSRS